MKYYLADYERNGYNDSDFFCIFYDDETGKIGQVETGTTRFASMGPADGGLPQATPEILVKAEEALARSIQALITEAENHDVFTPRTAVVGDRLRLLVDGKFKDKRSGTTVEYRAGDAGEVIWARHMGTFYANGYNKKGRDNCRVGIRLIDGRVVFVPLEKCRLDKEPDSEADLRARAVQLAKGHQWGGLFPHCAWLSHKVG